MTQYVRSFAAVIAVSLVGVCLSAGWADEVTKSSTARSSGSSSSGLFAPEGEESNSAQAITRQEREDGTLIVQVIEDDKMIRISQRPGKGITVIVVETVRDTEKVNRYTAKNEAALKARHPRGYELYERYAQSKPMVSDTPFEPLSGMTTADHREQMARYQAQIAQMKQQMQQMQNLQQLMQQRQAQAQAQQAAGMQRAAQFSRGAWGFGNARASGQASGSARASGSASSSFSSSGSSRGK